MMSGSEDGLYRLVGTFVDSTDEIRVDQQEHDEFHSREIIDQDKQIEYEIENGIIPDPNAPPPEEMGGDPGMGMDLGAPVTDPEESSAVVEPPKGGEI